METKVKENKKTLGRVVLALPRAVGRLESCFGKRLASPPCFTLASFLFSFFFFFPELFPSCHSGCYGVIPELSVPRCRLFFSYSLNVIKHVSRHRRDCYTCQCQDKLSEFDKEFMVSVFFQGVMDGALVLLTSLRM